MSRPPPLPGTRPEGTSEEKQAARAVQEMFTRIAPRYDFLNHLLSLSLDRLWRRRTARALARHLAGTESRALDLCCGTGDLALELARLSRGLVVGTDFVHPMLARAREKALRYGFLEVEGHGFSRAEPALRGGIGNRQQASLDAGGQGGRAERSGRQGSRVLLVEADALELPFADAQFEVVTAAFGFRNLANYRRGLEEIYRVLKPGGEVGILEFSMPRRGLLAALYGFYFRRVLPWVGQAVSGVRGPYSYLPASVEKFPNCEEFSRWLEAAGFRSVSYEQWTAGTVALHRGTKP